MSEYNSILTRRTVLTTTAALGVTGLAGCNGDEDGGDSDDGGEATEGTPAEASDNDSGEPTEDTSTDAGDEDVEDEPDTADEENDEPDNDLQLVHGWLSGLNKEAITALINGFQEKYPDIGVAAESVSGPSPTTDQAVLNKLQANDPPSTFQTWPGKNLEQFDGAFEDIEDVIWDDELKQNYLAGPKKQAQHNGTYVTVPLNIHRINNLFYNMTVVEQAGVDPMSLSSPSDVLNACETIAAETDAIPFAHQTNSTWSTIQLWETILLGQAGIDGYNALITGNGDRDSVESALEVVKRHREYYPPDASSISYMEANTMIIEGDAGFIHKGDWAEGDYSSRDGFSYSEDWNQVPYPGTSGSYLLNMDSFPYMANNPSPGTTREFLNYCGSAEGQILFNEKKKSIPPRSDADVSNLNAFQQDQFEDYIASDNQPPSIQHGLAVSPMVKTDIQDAFNDFLERYDISRTADSLISAFN